MSYPLKNLCLSSFFFIIPSGQANGNDLALCEISSLFLIFPGNIALIIRRNPNVHKTFKRRPRHLLNILCAITSLSYVQGDGQQQQYCGIFNWRDGRDLIIFFFTNAKFWIEKDTQNFTLLKYSEYVLKQTRLLRVGNKINKK